MTREPQARLRPTAATRMGRCYGRRRAALGRDDTFALPISVFPVLCRLSCGLQASRQQVANQGGNQQRTDVPGAVLQQFSIP